MNYELIRNQIVELIIAKRYTHALELINRVLEYSGADVKELIDLKASVLIELNQYDEALELYKDTLVYDRITVKDKKTFENLAIIYERLGHVLQSKAMGFHVLLLEGIDEKIYTYTQPIQEEIARLQEQIEEDADNENLYYALAYQHVQKLQVVEACIYYRKYEILRANKRQEDNEVEYFIKNYQNAIRFYEQLSNQTHVYCFILEEDAAPIRKKEIFIKKVLASYAGQVYEVAPSYEALLKLNEQYGQEDSLLVLGENTRLMKLMKHIPLFKVMQKAYMNRSIGYVEAMGAVYMGNYLYTAKFLYGFDVPYEMHKPPEVKISIVIPTRSYSYTLKDTLRTCLNQRFEDYEVVVSDNSDEGDLETYNLIKEMNNEKLHYYRTPYKLSLAKSFEYAYLRTRGEFIFAIGADDGVFPYALHIINQVLNAYPNENVLMWSKLFYIWPGLGCTGQGNQFTFPIHVDTTRINISCINSMNYINYVINLINQKNAVGIYGLPMLYINSGMRRRHIFEMINRTGKFLDGTSQDVYTGIMTLAMYETFLSIDTPLTIAGMCENSIGLATVVKNGGAEKYKQFVSEYNHCIDFTDIPGTPSQKVMFPHYDYLLFVYEFFKICDLEIAPKCIQWKQAIQFKNLLEWSLLQFDISGHIYLDIIAIARECVKQLDADTKEWFEEVVRPYEAKPRTLQVVPPPDTVWPKNYVTGLNNDQLTIDGSQFDIKNVYEASQFFVHLLNL